MEIELFKTMEPFRQWLEQLGETTHKALPPNTDSRLPDVLAVLLYDQVAVGEPITFGMLFSGLQRSQKLLLALEKQADPPLQKAIGSQLSTRKVLLPYIETNQESGPAVLESLPVSNKFGYGSDFRKQLLQFLDQ
jgi:hypothetical protein